jgi:hypothetical protein
MKPAREPAAAMTEPSRRRGRVRNGRVRDIGPISEIGGGFAR